MAPGSQADADGGRSGGKILKRRSIAARNTPYDRPTRPPPPPSQPESPSWFNGLVFPAKFVAGGATKLLSSFWNPKTWGSPSSSSSDIGSDSDGVEDDSEDNENASDGVVVLNKKCNFSGKSEILHLIEQLLMLEHFSREECDRLIEIINSRVVDYSMRDGVDAGPSNIWSRTNNETPDIRNQAIMEAKKWVMEKKVGSSLKSDLDNGIYAFKSVMTPNITEGEAGSPVDVARSYMRARPPWASPINHNNSPTPSPSTAYLFKEVTPYSPVGGNSFPSAKRDYLSAGSWNIQEEIRRLRSKATEDMLSSHRSWKVASSALELDAPEHSLANDKAIEPMKLNELSSLEAPKSVDEIANLPAEGGTPRLSDTRTTPDGSPAEALPSHPTALVLEQYQAAKGMDSDEMVEGQEAASNKSHAVHPDNEHNTRPSGEENGIEREEDTRLSDERNPEHERLKNGDRMVNDINPIEGNCEFVTESTEVPNVNEAISIANNPQGGSNTNDHGLVGKAYSPAGKRAVTRANSRRGRGRGK